jgi:hypothetical protein
VLGHLVPQFIVGYDRESMGHAVEGGQPNAAGRGGDMGRTEQARDSPLVVTLAFEMYGNPALSGLALQRAAFRATPDQQEADRQPTTAENRRRLD